MGVVMATKAERLLQKPPQSRVHRNEGKLGAIVDNSIDISAVLRIYNHDGYLDPVKILIDPVEFQKGIIGPLPTSRKPSRFMLRHVSDMEECRVAERAVPGSLRYYLTLFTVEKKNLDLRLIQDCRDFNKAFRTPSSMDLPLVHDLIDEILKHELMGQSDAVSYFYQFELEKTIRRMFGARLTGSRITDLLAKAEVSAIDLYTIAGTLVWRQHVMREYAVSSGQGWASGT